MNEDNEFPIAMVDFIPFINKILLLEEIEAEAHLNIYVDEQENESHFNKDNGKSIFQYYFQDKNSDSNVIVFHFLLSNEIANHALYDVNIVQYNIVVNYQSVYRSLAEYSIKIPILHYLIMMLKEVEQSGVELDEFVYAELYQLCFQYKKTMDNPDLHYYNQVKQKSLN